MRGHTSEKYSAAARDKAVHTFRHASRKMAATMTDHFAEMHIGQRRGSPAPLAAASGWRGRHGQSLRTTAAIYRSRKDAGDDARDRMAPGTFRSVTPCSLTLEATTMPKHRAAKQIHGLMAHQKASEVHCRHKGEDGRQERRKAAEDGRTHHHSAINTISAGAENLPRMRERACRGRSAKKNATAKKTTPNPAASSGTNRRPERGA